MHSPADRRPTVRIWLERAAHALALAIVVWLLVRALRPEANDDAQLRDVNALSADLVRWSTVAPPPRVHLALDTALAPATRDWLAAIAAAGAQVTWEGEGALPIAAAVEPVADPAGGTRIWTAAPAGAPIVLEDGYGVLDSTSSGVAGARFTAQSTVPDVKVHAGALTAHSASLDSLSFRRVLLVGRVGWEAKFVAAALEERGWLIDARLTLSPKGHVTQGTEAPIDTGRYSAVIILDDTPLAGSAQLARYVRDGGGLIVAGPAVRASATSALRAGSPGSTVAAIEPFDSAATDPRRPLGVVPIALRNDAVPLERRDALVTVAARRVEKGRVITVGYEDTWRWRLGGNAAALDEHRSWWAGLVAGVAYVGRTPRASEVALDEAPLVNLVETLGAPSAAPSDGSDGRRIPDSWLLGVFATALLAEWLSRRLRGAP